MDNGEGRDKVHRNCWRRRQKVVFAGAMSGEFLLVQLIYQGKTKPCLPKVKFPDGWDVTCSPTHWSNECLTKDYILKILVPYRMAPNFRSVKFSLKS